MKGQKERLLRHLEDYGSITSAEAMHEYGVMRLASRIDELRKLGYPIQTEMVKGRNRYDEETRYARYRMGART